VTGGEISRLAALERTLMGAAAREAQRRRTRRRRLVAALAVAVLLVMLAAAASLAATRGFFDGVDQQLTALRDDRLIPRTAPSPGLAYALGARPRDAAGRREWVIAGKRLSGFTTASGSFCFRFGRLTGGCVQPGELTPENPLSYTYDYGPATFRVYGLAMDGVRSVSLRARGVTHRVLLVRNAIYFAEPSLGGTGRLAATLLVRMHAGTTLSIPILARGGIAPTGNVLPRLRLPGAMPAGDTAA
jgi:hypothetical protein